MVCFSVFRKKSYICSCSLLFTVCNSVNIGKQQYQTINKTNKIMHPMIMLLRKFSVLSMMLFLSFAFI